MSIGTFGTAYCLAALKCDNTKLLLYYPTQFNPDGFTDVAVTACISGSLICLITTGIPNSHINNFLSSELDTNFLF